MTTRRISIPSDIPVDLDDMKAHLRVTSGDEDALITTLINVAMSEIEALSSRCVAPAGYTLFAPPPRLGEIFLEVTPARALSQIEVVRPDGEREILDLTKFTLTDHPDTPSVIGNFGSLARRSDAVRITYQAGYGDTASDTPPDLAHAIKLLAAHRFEVREEVVIGTITSVVHRSVDHLVSLHRVRTFG